MPRAGRLSEREETLLVAFTTYDTELCTDHLTIRTWAPPELLILALGLKDVGGSSAASWACPCCRVSAKSPN
jgi:hypothetical protein